MAFRHLTRPGLRRGPGHFAEAGTDSGSDLRRHPGRDRWAENSIKKIDWCALCSQPYSWLWQGRECRSQVHGGLHAHGGPDLSNYESHSDGQRRSHANHGLPTRTPAPTVPATGNLPNHCSVSLSVSLCGMAGQPG